MPMPMNDNREEMQSLKNITTVVYVLQALSFFLGVTSIVAIIINYVKRPEVSSTWLASHFRWQMRTFWFGLLWMVVGALTLILAVGYLVITVNAIWIIYRIVKGWLYLHDGKPLYVVGNY